MAGAQWKVALVNDTRRDGHFGCSLVIQQLISLLRSQGIEVDWFWPVGRDWHGQIDWSRAEAELDGIVVNGEGTIHRTAERDRARWLTELPAFVRQNTGLPIFLLNAGIHDVDPDCAANLRAYSGIYVRDQQSRRNLDAHGIASQVVPDLSMSATFPEGQRRSGICATDSVLPEVTDELRRACRNRGWRYRSLRFAKKGKLRLKSCLSDLPWFLINKYRPETLPQRFAAFTARQRLIITGRYHMVAYCLLTETPFVAIESNTPKIAALLEDVFGNCRRLVAAGSVDQLNPADFDRFTEAEAGALRAFLTRGRDDTAAMMGRIRDAFAQDERRRVA